MTTENANGKREFSVRSFRAFMNRFDREGFPDMSTTSWKDIMRDGFALTPEQSQSMERLSEELSAEVQSRFAEVGNHYRSGSRVRGRIVTQENGSHLAFWSVEPQQSSPVAGGSGKPNALLIEVVCCDANCGDWDWLCNG